MAAVDIPAVGHAEDSHGDPDAMYLTAKRGIWSWLTTLDHKRIGIMYLVMRDRSRSSLGGIFALLVRARALHARQDASSTRTPTTASSRCTAR